MSLDATRWAWQQQGLRPLQKLILLSLADRAGPDDSVWPSYVQIAADTGADRKTICAAIKALKVAGILVDTGERRGKTGQVQVLRLVGVVHRYEERSQKRNDSQNGTVPFFPSNSTENGIVNDPKNGIRNLPLNLPGNLSSAPGEKSPAADAEKVPAKPKEKPKAISLSDSGDWVGITQQLRILWGKAYPALNLDAELASAAAWIVANPSNRKSNYQRYLTNWLKRAQDRAPRAGGSLPAQPSRQDWK